MIKKIAIFASGTGTNAEKIIQYFAEKSDVSVAAIYSNNSNAGVLGIAEKHQIPFVVFGKKEFYDSDAILKDLASKNATLIVLAGFLWLVPESLITAYPHKIINIHPALLHKYGGKGMYGMNVHQAVSESGDSETGITVHFVNDKYDQGEIISQIRIPIIPGDLPENIARKVLNVEHEYFPMIIDKLLEKKYYESK